MLYWHIVEPSLLPHMNDLYQDQYAKLPEVSGIQYENQIVDHLALICLNFECLMILLPSLLNIIFHLNDYYKAQYTPTFSIVCDTFKVNLTKEID